MSFVDQNPGRSTGVSSREEIKEAPKVEDAGGKTCRA